MKSKLLIGFKCHTHKTTFYNIKNINSEFASRTGRHSYILEGEIVNPHVPVVIIDNFNGEVWAYISPELKKNIGSGVYTNPRKIYKVCGDYYIPFGGFMIGIEHENGVWKNIHIWNWNEIPHELFGYYTEDVLYDSRYSYSKMSNKFYKYSKKGIEEVSYKACLCGYNNPNSIDGVIKEYKEGNDFIIVGGNILSDAGIRKIPYWAERMYKDVMWREDLYFLLDEVEKIQKERKVKNSIKDPLAEGKWITKDMRNDYRYDYGLRGNKWEKPWILANIYNMSGPLVNI